MKKSTIAIYYLAVGLTLGWFGKAVEVVRIPELVGAIKNGTLYSSPAAMINDLLYQSVLLAIIITANLFIAGIWVSKALANYKKRRRTSKALSKAEARVGA